MSRSRSPWTCVLGTDPDRRVTAGGPAASSTTPEMSAPPPPAASPHRVIFVFLDGVGIGPDDESLNPFLTADLPVLRGLLGGDVPRLDEHGHAVPVRHGHAVAVGLDATMGVDGTPQSGTGQAALLTGENAAASFGRHFGPWIPSALRDVVATRSVFRRALDAGVRSQVANAYPSTHRDRMMRKRTAGFPLAAFEAGLLVRDEGHLARGDALPSEILTVGWRRKLGHTEVPMWNAVEAGQILARLTDSADFTSFAHYSTDTAGHEEAMPPAVTALERVDRFLGGLLGDLGDDALLVIGSDHGNIEDVSVGHTRNPTFALAVGPGSERIEAARSITDLPGLLLGALAADLPG